MKHLTEERFSSPDVARAYAVFCTYTQELLDARMKRPLNEAELAALYLVYEDRKNELLSGKAELARLRSEVRHASFEVMSLHRERLDGLHDDAVMEAFQKPISNEQKLAARLVLRSRGLVP